ncbi:DoxX family protein [Silvibacterium acidisoli]|uniref:DoxX family protein n=1 Tax=Acidobacteriaceae bacterium ZG23-2 TaxID=2883246 RepID=UPI00406C390D
MRWRRAGIYAQALFYMAAGINHFWHPAFYLAVMPDHYAHPALMVQLSGVAEIAGGLGLLLPQTRRTAALGIAAMLIVFLDVHLYMIEHAMRFFTIPEWVLWVRLSLQFPLIAWALVYARKERPTTY